MILKSRRHIVWEPVVFLLILAMSSEATVAQEIANADSFIIGPLLFIAGSDKHEYSYSDSIHVRLTVLNSEPQAVLIIVNLVCQGVRAQETWCPPPGSSLECFTIRENLSSCVRPLGGEGVMGVRAGLTVLDDFIVRPFHTLAIPPDWTFLSGRLDFDSPWQPPPRVLSVFYQRDGLTAIQNTAWSTVKRLFR